MTKLFCFSLCYSCTCIGYINYCHYDSVYRFVFFFHFTQTQTQYVNYPEINLKLELEVELEPYIVCPSSRAAIMSLWW